MSKFPMPEMAHISTDDLVVTIARCLDSNDPLERHIAKNCLAIIVDRKPEGMALNEFIGSQPSMQRAAREGIAHFQKEDQK